MTTIKTSCSVCGDVELTPAQIRLEWVADTAPVNTYSILRREAGALGITDEDQFRQAGDAPEQGREQVAAALRTSSAGGRRTTTHQSSRRAEAGSKRGRLNPV